MAKEKGRTTLWINEEIGRLLPKYIDRFGSQTKAITSVFVCYDTMMKMERRKLKELFNRPEINLMLNNALSTVYLPQTIPGAVLIDTEDEIDSNFIYFGVDRAKILDKLRGLTLSQQFALVDWLLELRGNEEPEPEVKDE
jgi:hypothetical protein